MAQDEVADRMFHFELSEKCIIINLKDSNDIKFNTESVGRKRYVSGFSVFEKGLPKSVGEFDATQKAIVLSNYMSVQYGKSIRPSLTSITETKTDGTSWLSKSFRSGWSCVKELDFDLNDPKVDLAISDRDQNILYEHASRGIKAAQEEDPVTMVREFYQVIEQSILPHLVKFTFLRHALSHSGSLRPNTIVGLENGFGRGYFMLTASNEFDYTSPENIRHLNEHANILMTEALKTL